jgi:hypothetical protein
MAAGIIIFLSNTYKADILTSVANRHGTEHKYLIWQM